MNAKDIRVTMANLARAKWVVEEALEENGGEITPELLEPLDLIEDMKAALTDGVDDLGRWLKSVQDETAALKAEADAAARKVKNHKGYEEYIKSLIGQVMDVLDLPTNNKGEKVVKGSYYGFKRTTSNKSAVNQDALDAKFLEIAQVGARMNGLPDYVDVVLKTTTKELREADATEFLEETSTPAISFTKPRANSAKKEEE